MPRTLARLPLLLILTALLTIIPLATAQTQDDAGQPDLTIPLAPNYNADATTGQITVRFAVYNKGEPTDGPLPAALIDRPTGDTLASDTDLIPVMRTGQTADNLTISFDASQYQPGSTQQVTLVVGSEALEGEQRFSDNQRTFSVEIPFSGQTAEPTQDNVFVIPSINVEIDLEDERTRLLLAGIIGLAGVIILILWLIVRVIVNSRPAFGNWQPPYANMPPLDPDTNYGRRQQWQQYAQNNVVPSPCTPGTIIPRKLLLGMDGRYLSGWQISALRMTQYDMYGRVSRSQVLAKRGEVRRVDRLAHRADSMKTDRLRKRLRPVARSIARQFKRKVSKRSAMLAIALDVRLRGRHGEVRIIFELYDCRGGQPGQLDQWEPEMTVLGKAIYESYTYTIFGQHGGESYRDFRKRLAADVEGALLELVSGDGIESPATGDTQGGTPVSSEDTSKGQDAPDDPTPPRGGDAVQPDDDAEAGGTPTASYNAAQDDDDEIQL